MSTTRKRDCNAAGLWAAAGALEIIRLLDDADNVWPARW
jgi:hypothetical protein